MDTSVLIWIALGITLAVVIFAVIMWSLTVQTVPTYSPAPQYTAGGLGTRCTTSSTPPPSGQNTPTDFQPQPCATGLACINNFCLKDIGTACVSLSECVPSAIVCNGFCSADGKFVLGETCSTTSQCDVGLICDNLVCLTDTGLPCTAVGDCISADYCNTSIADSVCTPLSTAAQLCTPIAGVNTCVDGYLCSPASLTPIASTPYFCQPVGVDTGSNNSLCYLWTQQGAPIPTDGEFYKYVDINDVLTAVPSCDTFSVCNINRSFVDGLPGLGNEPVPGYGFCNPIGQWNGPCPQNVGCQVPQVCINSQCEFPLQASTDPNANGIKFPLSCDDTHSTGICLTNYSCSPDFTLCLGENDNIPVTAGSQCVSGNMSTTSSIVLQDYQQDSDPSPDRLTTASWTNTGIMIPAALDGVPSYNITFTSFESDSGISALLQQFTNNVYYICTTSAATEYTISANIVGNFTTNVSYTGTLNGNPDPTATVSVSYIGNADYVGYSMLGNYYCVVRYTIQPYTYPSPPFAGYPLPLLGDFSRIYYDTDPTFANSNLTTDPTTGSYIYIQYLPDSTTSTNLHVSYIYHASVDDRVIDPNFTTSVRMFIVVQDMENINTGPPQNAINENVTLGSLQQPGAVIALDFDSTLPYYSLVFSGVSLFPNASGVGVLDYTLTWAEPYISRTMEITNPLQQFYAKPQQSDNSNLGRLRLYYPSTSTFFFYNPIPYQTNEGEVRYCVNPNFYTSKHLDLNGGLMICIAEYSTTFNPGVILDVYFNGSINNIDFVLPATVTINSLPNIPFVSADLDTIGYIPKILLFSNVCA